MIPLNPNNLSDLLINRNLLKPIPTQQVSFPLFVGLELQFSDDITSIISDIITLPDHIIGICPVNHGFRSLFYRPTVQ